MIKIQGIWRAANPAASQQQGTLTTHHTPHTQLIRDGPLPSRGSPCGPIPRHPWTCGVIRSRAEPGTFAAAGPLCGKPSAAGLPGTFVRFPHLHKSSSRAAPHYPHYHGRAFYSTATMSIGLLACRDSQVGSMIRNELPSIPPTLTPGHILGNLSR